MFTKLSGTKLSSVGKSVFADFSSSTLEYISWGGFHNQNPYNHNPYCVGILIGFVGILVGSVGILIGFVWILIGSD